MPSSQVFRDLTSTSSGPMLPAAWLGVGSMMNSSLRSSILVQAWNSAEGPSKSQLGETVHLALRVLLAAHVILAVLLVAASVGYVVAVASGRTALPRWMSLLNPALMMVAYTIVERKVLPPRVTRYVEGAGFNIVYFTFFALLLSFIW